MSRTIYNHSDGFTLAIKGIANLHKFEQECC
jgi:hypothetical protein